MATTVEADIKHSINLCGEEDWQAVERPSKRDWSIYNRAQTEEMQRFAKALKITMNAVTLPDLWTGIGRPPADLEDVIKGIAVMKYLSKPYRRGVSWIRGIQREAEIGEVYHFNTYGNYMRAPFLTPILDEVLTVTSLLLGVREEGLAVDSTGFGPPHSRRWRDVKNDNRESIRCRKMHAMCGVKSNIITSATVTPGPSGDSPEFPELLERTSDNFPIGEVYGDPAYLSRRNCDLVEDSGGMPFFKPKSNTTRKAKRSKAWRDMILHHERDSESFMKRYHKRSNVESTFSSIKMRLSPHLRSRTETAKENELLVLAILHNINMVAWRGLEWNTDILA